jgi:hypothetical protein
VGERDGGAHADAGEGAGAKAGAGAPPQRRTSNPPRRKGGRKRGDTIVDAALDKLLRGAGTDKPAPDVSAEERHYSRSLRIRRLVEEFLQLNEGTSWANLLELHARAANYAGCASTTASRWVYQFTRAGMRHKLIEAVDHWMLERRG